MSTRLSILTYAQHWDGSALRVRLLLIPRGSPLDPLGPGDAAFADAQFAFDLHVVPGLDDMPLLGSGSGTIITAPAIASARPVFESLATMYQIDPAPPPANPRRAGTQIRKHLPSTYVQAVSFAGGRTPWVFTDDSYSCALNAPMPRPYVKLPPPNPLIPWGKVFAILLRQKTLAEAAGLVRTLDVTVDSTTPLASGGWVYATLSPSGDGASLLGSSDALKIYAARLPTLTVARDVFTPVLFPVAALPGSGNYDDLFAEVDDYDDGFAKAVHCAQPQQLDPLQETPDGTRPAKELGIRLGWDDEQVTIWLNRQIDPAAAVLDAPMGVLGYRVDVRESGTADWRSLVRASGPVSVNAIDLGRFDGELGVETHPVQLHAQSAASFWLPTYFTAWTGPSLVTLDTTTIRLAGGPDKSGANRVAGKHPDIALRYGRDYDFRVRLMDHTGEGPPASGAASIPGPAPVGSVAFRRWIRPLRPTLVDPPPPDADPDSPPSRLTVRRPLLHHPAVGLTGAYANVTDLLLADLPVAAAEQREVGLPDPDVDSVRIVVEAEGLAQDPLASDGGYAVLYETTRNFPVDPFSTLIVDLAWADVHDASTLAGSTNGPIVLPTARNVRLRIASRCRDDAALRYFGADDVRFSAGVRVELRKSAVDERSLFAPDLPSRRLRALFLQPDPVVDATLLFAQRAGGQMDQRPSDVPSRLAAQLGLRNDGMTFRGRPGVRTVFGCAAALRHVIGPDGASVAFASQSELTRQWIVVVHLVLDRDWSWDGFEHDGLVVERDGLEVGRFAPGRSAGTDALSDPVRARSELVFFDAVDPKPATGTFPAELHSPYTVRSVLKGSPAQDPPLKLVIRLPVTTPPAQRPRLVSAGIAMSPYERSPDYSATQPRRRALWLEFDRPCEDPHDRYFARMMRVAPDPLLSQLGDDIAAIAEPPLAVDPEWVRAIVPSQSEDHVGQDAMQELVASDSPLHYMLPLPPGMDENSPQLFGFFTYEIRVGHVGVWSTAQGRFGTPLRVAGVQHPSPGLNCAAVRNKHGITASAPFALPVFEARSVQPLPPHSEIWILLYAQAEQIDGEDHRNVLLGRKRAFWRERTFGDSAPAAVGNASFTAVEVSQALQSMAFSGTTPLSVLAVELLPNGVSVQDPLGEGLGRQRILRTSPLVPVPEIC